MSLADQTVNTIKGLAMDAVQAANSGHPGAPMGMADIAYVLWGQVAKYDPADPAWPDRDRIVLSNGHASALLYSMLHLTGTSLSLDDLKNFRQWGSPTAGHPEHGEAPGIETTTGPLGQGIANGVGMALAERWLRERFSSDLVDHQTWVLCGDGCLMEGISSEGASIAGHLGLAGLTIIYDDNGITIDGQTDLAFSEDVAKRFEAMGWRSIAVDGHDHAALLQAMEQARAETTRPTIICARTTIGHGSPNLAGSNKTHGAPLGDAEIRATKEALGMDPDATFAVSEGVIQHVRENDGARSAERKAWEARLREHPQRERFQQFLAAPDLSNVAWPDFEVGAKLATRKASAAVLQALASQLENLVGGSADLAGSNGSLIKDGGDIGPQGWDNRNLHFGIREHAMASVCNGMVLHGGTRPYCATFLTFHDYMRPAVRLAALMKQPVIYIYTHDSVYLGEDGPTHQPVEHLMAMRSMPNLWVARPADAWETSEAWRIALERTDGPTAICLTRQGLPILDRDVLASADQARRGGYVLSPADGAKAILVATGSEVPLALDAQRALGEAGIPVSVVSLFCWELFEAQDKAYRDGVLPAAVPRISVEAGVTFGWGRYADVSIGIDRFGASAPGNVVADKLGINVDNIVSTVKSQLS